MDLRHVGQAVAGVHRPLRELPFEFAADSMEAVVASTHRDGPCEGSTAVDRGACVGRRTFPMAEAVGPHRHVFAVEAVPSTAKVLRANLQTCPASAAIQIHGCALANHHGASEP